MIKFENIDIQGLDAAFRGMRNPLQSWDQASYENDMELAEKLVKAGPSHCKFRRMITVWVDITAPMYFWKEFDTYKIGTVSNSTSMMHTLHKEPITIDKFSVEDLKLNPNTLKSFSNYVDILEEFRQDYIKHGDYWHWRVLIQMMPSSWNYKRTVMFNYEVAAKIYKERKNHKLEEWRQFCEIFMERHLPEFDRLICPG